MLLAAVVTPCLLYLGCRLILSTFTPFDDLPFDKARWARADQDTRTRMTDHLIQKHLKIGTTRTEALHLLGKPDATPDDLELLDEGDRKIRGHRVLQYSLGPLGDVPFHMDGMHLDIYFDANDRLTGVYVVQS